jgi:YD repeat-containing protein
VSYDEYDDVGNRLSKTVDGLTETYTYDAAGRLETVERAGVGGSSTEYQYDGVGNRLVERIGGVPVTFGYDAANRLRTRASGGPLRIGA